MGEAVERAKADLDEARREQSRARLDAARKVRAAEEALIEALREEGGNVG